MAECKGCGAQVRWLREWQSQKLAPVDPKPEDGGNIEIVKMAGGTAWREIKPRDIAGVREDGRPLHKLHFATCPNSSHFTRCDKCHKTPCRCQGSLF